MRSVPLRGLSLGCFLFVLASTAVATLAISPGDLLVTDISFAHGTDVSGIVDVNPRTGAQTLVSSGGYIGSPTALCFDISGNIILAAQLNTFGSGIGAIIRINPSSGQQSLVASGGQLGIITDMKLQPNGDLLIAQNDRNGGNGNIDTMDLATGVFTRIASGANLSVVGGVAVESTGNYLVANNQPLSAIIRVSPDTGAQNVLTSGGLFKLGPGNDLVNDVASNSLLVSESSYNSPQQSGLVNVNTITGAQSAVSLGGLFTNPRGLAQDLAGDTFVVDQNEITGSSSIIQVDLATGSQKLISSGGLLGYTGALVVVVPEPVGFAAVPVIATTILLLRIRRTCGREA